MLPEQENKLETHLERIKSLDNLAPNKQTNRVFSSLVEDIIDENIQADLKEHDKKILRSKCGEAEYKLEKHWTEKVLKSSDPKCEITEFPYYQNYLKLADFEHSTLLSCCEDPEKDALFVGGGPLPFTAIIFAKRYDFDITILDRDEEAVQLSKRFLEILEIDGDVIKSDAEEFGSYGDYGTIHVASMVGKTKEEELGVFKEIKSQKDSHGHIIARTVHGNRKILYRPVSEETKSLFNVLAESRPSVDIINSTIVMENS